MEHQHSIIASPSSSKDDFDFLEGRWKVLNRRLKENVWIEFAAELHMRKTLLGLGNIENYYAIIDGKAFEGQAVRLFNPNTRLWTVYWMDSHNPKMDENPVIGSFENGLGKLYAKKVFGSSLKIELYQWDATDKRHPKWSQATSDDDGKTWNWNWEMRLSKT